MDMCMHAVRGAVLYGLVAPIATRRWRHRVKRLLQSPCEVIGGLKDQYTAIEALCAMKDGCWCWVPAQMVNVPHKLQPHGRQSHGQERSEEARRGADGRG